MELTKKKGQCQTKMQLLVTISLCIQVYQLSFVFIPNVVKPHLVADLAHSVPHTQITPVKCIFSNWPAEVHGNFSYCMKQSWWGQPLSPPVTPDYIRYNAYMGEPLKWFILKNLSHDFCQIRFLLNPL